MTVEAGSGGAEYDAILSFCIRDLAPNFFGLKIKGHERKLDLFKAISNSYPKRQKNKIKDAKN
ncbi:hypothetical protein X559_0517 [Paenilisteria newyorkensis]|nr:hypothetical protein X559_0517 [Listeria newyorkensis]